MHCFAGLNISIAEIDQSVHECSLRPRAVVLCRNLIGIHLEFFDGAPLINFVYAHDDW